MIPIEEKYGKEIDAVIAKAAANRSQETAWASPNIKIFAYHYPASDGYTGWGVDVDGRNIARGLRRPEGADMPKSLPCCSHASGNRKQELKWREMYVYSRSHGLITLF